MVFGYEFPLVEVILFVPSDIIASSVTGGVVDEHGNIILPEIPIRP